MPDTLAALPGADDGLGGAGGPAHGALSEETASISAADIQTVQNLIEQCLQLYMSQREAMFTLQAHASVAPGFTALVWGQLEAQNADFFRAYYLRLKLKDQVVLFNHLLEQQVGMLARVAGVADGVGGSGGGGGAAAAALFGGGGGGVPGVAGPGPASGALPPPAAALPPATGGLADTTTAPAPAGAGGGMPRNFSLSDLPQFGGGG